MKHESHAPDLAIVFGKAKNRADNDTEQEETESNEAFTDYAVQAFPELEDEPERLRAFKRAIRACMMEYEKSEHEEG